jgi:AAA family ATP:ADP antiporter
MGAATSALLNTAEVLFLKRVGVGAMPMILLVSSALLVLATGAIGGVASASPARWLPRVLMSLGLALAPFVLLAASSAPAILSGLVIVARQIQALSLLAFWLAMVTLVPPRRAKQLFAPLAAGATLGGIFGSFGSGPMARLAGVEGLIGLCSLMLIASAVAGQRLRESGTRMLGSALASRPHAGPSNETTLIELVRTSRLFRLLGIALLCGGALSPVLYFQFITVLDAATQGADGEQRLLDFYAQFRGWVNVVILVSQLWLSAALYRRIGLPLSLALWPAAYLMGFSWLGLAPMLSSAFASFGAARVSEDGVADPATRVLFNLFPDHARARASGLLAGPVYRLGGMLGNALVLVALGTGGIAWIGFGALPVAGFWFASAILFWQAYPGFLLQASAEHGLAGADIDRAMLLDSSTVRRLSSGLVDPDPRMCRAAVDLVVDAEPTTAVRLLAQAVGESSPANRPLLVTALHGLVESLPAGAYGSAEATQALSNALLAQPPIPAEERADLLQTYARLTANDSSSDAARGASRELLERALGDRAAPVRLAAIAELHRRGVPPPGLPDLDRTLGEALAASDALIRRAARKELRAILLGASADPRWEARLRLLARNLNQRVDRADTAEALRDLARRHGSEMTSTAREAMKFVHDRDPRVRGAVFALAGHAQLVEEGPKLVSALGAHAREDVEGAREVLVALGPAAALPLLVGMEFGGPAQREVAVSLLRELEADSEILETLRRRQLEAIQESVLQRAAVDSVPGDLLSLLRRRLDERIAEGVGALLDLLAALHGDARLAVLERHLRMSAKGRSLDMLIEGIETLLSRAEHEEIVRLLEPAEWPAKAAIAARALDRSCPDASEALAELRRSPDEATRDIACAISLEVDGEIGDSRAMPSTMEIAVRLQSVPVFDRLSTQQLMVLAGLLQEQKVAEGERIFAAGEEGLSLYLVLEGEVELRRGDLVLDRTPADSFFGELSTLDGVPRSADAVATHPTRLLRLERDDLLRLLEEAPALALGLAQVLSARVRRLQTRLEDAVFPDEESGGKNP